MRKVRQPAPEPTSAGQLGADPPDDGPETGHPGLDSDPRAAAANALEAAAAAGNLKAIRMVADGVPQQLRGVDAQAEETMAPHVAAAMIAAGLYAHAVGPVRAALWLDHLRKLLREEEELSSGRQYPAGPPPHRPPGP